MYPSLSPLSISQYVLPMFSLAYIRHVRLTSLQYASLMWEWVDIRSINAVVGPTQVMPWILLGWTLHILCTLNTCMWYSGLSSLVIQQSHNFWLIKFAVVYSDHSVVLKWFSVFMFFCMTQLWKLLCKEQAFSLANISTLKITYCILLFSQWLAVMLM